MEPGREAGRRKVAHDEHQSAREEVGEKLTEFSLLIAVFSVFCPSSSLVLLSTSSSISTTK